MDKTVVVKDGLVLAQEEVGPLGMDGRGLRRPSYAPARPPVTTGRF